MQPVHYYHIWVGDHYHGSAWLEPAQEHFDRLAAGGFKGDVRVGIVGGVKERVGCLNWLRAQETPATVAVTADEGFEMVTLSVMHEWAKTADPATPVYYAHTKGAFQRCPMNTRWRTAMDAALLDPWKIRMAELEQYDAIGLHWLTHQQYPQWISPLRPMFGGNFWWVRAGYLATLAPVEYSSRWSAEGWVGTGFPKVLDVVPGWPDYTRERLLE